MNKMKIDISQWILIGSNLFTIALALVEGWGLSTVLVIYWWQNIIIGFFNVIRILTLQDITVKGKGNIPLSAFIYGKIFLAGFFALHYGFFHFGYYEFISGAFRSVDAKYVFLASLVFFANHLFSFIYNFKENSEPKDIGNIMFSPYQRIVPMHITIMAGIFILLIFRGALAEKLVLVFFLCLKTYADVKMHKFEHEGVRLHKKEGG